MIKMKKEKKDSVVYLHDPLNQNAGPVCTTATLTIITSSVDLHNHSD